MVNFKTTLQHIAADYNRRILLTRKQQSLTRYTEVLKPGMVCMVCYRLSRYFIQGRLKFFCPLLVLIEGLYTRNEISPRASIGPGLVLSDLGAIGIIDEAVIGENCTLLGFNTLTIYGADDSDLEEGAKVTLGNHCVLGVRSKVMRSTTIAHGCQIKEGSVVMFSVEKMGTTLMGNPARRRKVNDYNDIVNWNPLLGGPLQEA